MTAIAVSGLLLSACSSTAPEPAASGSDNPVALEDAAAIALLPDDVEARGSLSVASSLSYPPFEYTTAEGVNEGFNIDLVDALGEVLGLEIEIEKIPFESNITGLTNNRYDVAMASFSITPERQKQVDFIQVSNAATIVSVLEDSDAGIEGTSTLCGHTAGVITGAVAEKQIQQLNDDCVAAGEPEIEVSVFPNQSALVQALLNGRVEAKLDDSATTSYVDEQVGGAFEDVGSPYEPAPAGFAVAKNQPELRAALAAAMQSLIDGGRYDEIIEKWGQTKNAITTATVFTGEASSAEPTPTE